MTDSIRLDEQQIDGLCAKYDPANIEQFRVLLNQIPDPDDRAFVLEHEQAYMRARIEVFAALRAVREWAVAAGDYRRLVLSEVSDGGAGGCVRTEALLGVGFTRV